VHDWNRDAIDELERATMGARSRFFEREYQLGSAEWDIEAPQPGLIAVEAEGEIRGSVLDVGCGTGDNAIYLAQRGYAVTAVDASCTAIAIAMERARTRRADVDFQRTNALMLPQLGRTFDTAIDFGLLHELRGWEIARYVQNLAAVVRPGGRLIVQCFSDRDEAPEPERQRFSEMDLRMAFRCGWAVAWIRAADYEVRARKAHATWLAMLRRS
jgi:SAM-dependent methyltransferase